MRSVLETGKIDSNKNFFAVNGARNLNRPCNLKDFSTAFFLKCQEIWLLTYIIKNWIIV